MKVLVTGGTGRIGTIVVQWLLERGYAVRVIDTRSDREAPEGVEFARCDINDYPALLEQARGCEGVVHLAALASPASSSPDEVFRINAGGSFNVYRAAEEEGIRRVVQASSINAVGLYYGLHPADPLYLPLDEDHPPQTSDAYSFSKWMVEEIADYYWRRSGISGISLRFPGVSKYDTGQQAAQQRGYGAQVVEMVAAKPEAERATWLEQSLARINARRAQGMIEKPKHGGWIYSDDSGLTREERWLFSARSNLWTAIDVRDAAQAVEKGLSAIYYGSHALFVTEQNNTTGYPSEELARLFLPQVKARIRQLVGTESLVSFQKARDLIGFEPQYSLLD